MFKGGGNGVANSNLGQQVQSGVVDQLMQKFGLDQGQAGNIAGSLVPNVLQQMVHKTNDPNDSSFDIKGVLGKLVIYEIRVVRRKVCNFNISLIY